jgi:FAD/FMN-containing dehydrogenase
MARRFRNWADNVSFVPERYAEPRTSQELCDLVTGAAALRVAGRGHSFNRALECRGTLVSIERLNRVLHVDREACTVDVEAGIRLGALNQALAAEGLSISSPGDVDYQTLAGLVSTASHGSHLGFSTISDFIRRITLVDGRGRLRTLTAADGALFQAASVGVGLTGVIVSLTLACEPLFYLQKTQEVVSRTEALAAVDAHAALAAPEHLELWCFPFTERVLLIRKRRIDASQARGLSRLSRLSSVVIENLVLQGLLELVALAPRLVPRLMGLLASLAGGAPESDLAYRIYRSTRLFRAVDCEVAVPLECTRAALERLDACVSEHAGRRSGAYHLNLPTNVRFIAGSHQGLLNPAFGRRSTYVDISTYQRFSGHAALFGDFERALAELGGRSHWGKLMVTNPLARYPVENVSAFREARRELDPDEKFVSPFLRERLPELF